MLRPMLDSLTTRKLDRLCVYSGALYILLMMIGLVPLAGFFPSQPPSYDAAQISDLYRREHVGIRIGMVLVLLASMFYVPWTAILAKTLARIEGSPGVLCFCQIIAGTTNVLLTAYPAGWWLIASFRLDRPEEIVLLLNDIGWLQFLGVIAPFYFVVVTLIVGSLLDRHGDPLIPRWVGYFNLWFLITLFPLNVIFFFKSGPFAWNGLFGFYLPFVVFWCWFLVMMPCLLKTLKRDDYGT